MRFTLVEYLQAGYQQLAKELPPSPVFPQLTCVTIFLPRPLETLPQRDIFTMLLPPTVMSLTLKFQLLQQCWGQAFTTALLGGINLPNLQSFSIHTPYEQHECEECDQAVAKIIQAHKTIKELHVHIGTRTKFMEILEAAGQLPELRDVSFVIPGKRSINEQERIVLSLQKSQLTKARIFKLGENLACVNLILGLSTLINVEEVRVALKWDENESSIQTTECICSFSRFTRLRVLEMTLPRPVSWSEIATALSACHQLQIFTTIATDEASLDVNEYALDILSESWPCLKTLTLSTPFSNSYHRRAQPLRLHHLVAIASKFQSIRHLSVWIDATRSGNLDFNLQNLTTSTQLNETLEQLDVGGSAIGLAQIDLIAALLRTCCPKLRALGADDRSGYSWVWVKVNDGLRHQS
ncbi:hypothetical protein FRB90_012657 [Tulasnella sp. 427]|nr:hypothetical protein FRB90_012657 [Tulasnella sp. 427]